MVSEARGSTQIAAEERDARPGAQMEVGKSRAGRAGRKLSAKR